ncbi:MAG: Rab family GTPase, partial [Candidatus Kariarchaeaceae archaeon]
MNSRETRLYHPVKIVLIGDSGVGKTSLRKRYLDDSFNINYFPTLGADYSVKSVSLDSKIALNVNIWDIAGQESLSFLRQRFLVDTWGALVIFDLTNKESLENIT